MNHRQVLRRLSKAIGLFGSVLGIGLFAWSLPGLSSTPPPPSLTDAATASPHASLLQQGQEEFARGAFEQAAEIWKQAAEAAHDAGRVVEESDARVALAQAYLALGFQNRAAQNLDLAVALAQAAQDKSRASPNAGS